MGEKILTNCTSKKGLIFRIYKELKQISMKKKFPSKSGQKTLIDNSQKKIVSVRSHIAIRNYLRLGNLFLKKSFN